MAQSVQWDPQSTHGGTSHGPGAPLLHTQSRKIESEGFGEKKIGLLGGWSLLWNNITGPAMVALAGVYLNAGWFPASLMLAVVGVISGFGGGFLIEAMGRIPGNKDFDLRIEMMYLAKKLLSQWGYRVAMFLFIVNLQLQNIVAIIQSTQTADYTIQAIGGRTCGVEVYPHPGWTCTDPIGSGSGSGAADGMVDGDSPFGQVWIVSVGFVIVLVLTIPLGYFNLDDNINVQVAAAFLLIFFVLIGWIYEFTRLQLDWDGVALVDVADSVHRCRGLANGKPESCATQGGLGSQIGPIVFNYAYVVTLPSWINEMKPGLSVNKQLWGALIPGICTFIMLGWVSAAYYQAEGVSDSNDLLSALTAPGVSSFAKIASFVFPPAALISGIPIFSIVIRYNLLENQICNKFWANVAAVLFPWAVALVFYTGSFVTNLLNYVSLASTIPLNLTLPCYLFILAAREFPENGGYRCIPGLSDGRAVVLAKWLAAISILFNLAAIVFTGVTGGLVWQN